MAVITPPMHRERSQPEDASRTDPGVAGRPHARRVLVGLGWFALVLPFVLEVVKVVRTNHVALVQRLPDDAFYYFEIATRAARGEGLTFDGINETNGFHPVWQAVLIPLAALFRGDQFVRTTLLVAIVASFIAVLLVVRLVWRSVGPGPALLGGIVATQFALPSWINGMEGPIVLLSLAVLATSLEAASQRDTRIAWAMTGMVSALLVLSRLDFALLLVVIPIAIWLRVRSARSVVSWAGGCALLGLPVAAWWLARWGHVLTTSATVKQADLDREIASRFGSHFSFGYVRFLKDLTRQYLDAVAPWTYVHRVGVAPRAIASLVALSLLCFAFVGLYGIVRRTAQHNRRLRLPASHDGWALIVIGIVVALKAALDLVVAPLWAAAWYSAPQRLAIGLLVGGLAWAGVRVVVGKRIGVVIVVVSLAMLAVPVNVRTSVEAPPRGHDTRAWQDEIDLAANWISDRGPEGTYGARDAGLLAFRLDEQRTVVNLDGLVNDYGFAEFIENDRPLRDRLVREDVDYFVGRLTQPALRDVPCAHVLWTSPDRVGYADSFRTPSVAHVYVLDTRSC